MFSRTTIEDELPRRQETSVAHYTRIGTLQHFMPDPETNGPVGWISARATPVQFLNDRRELYLGLEVFRDAADRPPRSSQRVRGKIDELQTTSGRTETDAFQMSFGGDRTNSVSGARIRGKRDGLRFPLSQKSQK